MLQDGWPICDFVEYIYGRKPLWAEATAQAGDLEDYISGKKLTWHLRHQTPPLCQCGVAARRGVVPSELGYGWFCGNTIGDNEWVRPYYRHVIVGFISKQVCIYIAQDLLFL